MIKNLKRSSITYTPFKTFKDWKFDSVNSSSAIPFQVREGLKFDGIFFPTESVYYGTDPINTDGTYKRVIYNSIDHAFYRNDDNPLKCFGVENFSHETSNIQDRVAVLQLNRKYWGEKIVPNSVKITDYSNPDEVFEIVDDGNTNLVVKNKTFTSRDLIYPTDFPHSMDFLSNTIELDLISNQSINDPITNEVDINIQTETIDLTIDKNVYYTLNNGVKDYFDKSQAIELWKNGLGPVYVDDAKLYKTYTYVTQSYIPENERFGYSVSTDNDLIIVGCPCDTLTFSENKSGNAFIYKNNQATNKQELIKKLCLYQSQGSIINEDSNAHLIETEFGEFVLYENGNLFPPSGTYVSQDGFGKSVSMNGNFAAVSAPYATFNQPGATSSQSIGLVMCYQGNKGGDNNWGLINILQGTYASDEFGYSTSIYNDTLAVGAPGYSNNKGCVYIFKLKKYMSGQCDSVATSSISDSYLEAWTTGSISDIVTSGSNSNFIANFYAGLWQTSTEIPTSTNVQDIIVPNYVVGDFTWRLTQIIIGDESNSRFGGDVSISNGVLVVGNGYTGEKNLIGDIPSISQKLAWIYEQTLSGSICPSETWDFKQSISSSGIITNNLPNGLDGNNTSSNFFGCSVSTNGEYIAIGSPKDTIFNSNDIGSVYLYKYNKDIVCGATSSNKSISFVDRLYSNVDVLEPNDFGYSVSMNYNRLVVGAPTDFTYNTTVQFNTGSNKFIVNNFTESFDRNDYGSIQGSFYIYDISDGYSLEKKVDNRKISNTPNRIFGKSVSIGNKLISVGSSLHTTQSNQNNYFLDNQLIQNVSNWENSACLEMKGSVHSYNISDLSENVIIGNVFYKNGTFVLTHTGSQFSRIFFDSGSYGYNLEYRGQQTINEQEIIIPIERGEFNVSTNPSSLVNDIIFDVNRDGLFDYNDMSVIFKYLSSEPIVDTADIPDSIGSEQNMNWWNNGSILTESDDLLLATSVFDSVSTLGLLTQERHDYITTNLVETGILNIDGNYDLLNPLPIGKIDKNDGLILFKYFTDTLTPTELNKLIDGTSTRTCVRDIFMYLDSLTGRSSGGLLTKKQAEIIQYRSGSTETPMYGTNNGSLIDPNFFNYLESSSLNRTGSYLSPYITTIGLYSKGQLVAVAKLGKPIKNLIDYPMNIAVRFDFG